MPSNTRIRGWLAIAVLLFSIDQLSKIWVLANLKLHQTVKLIPNLNLTLAYNKGAAFGVLSDAGGWQRWMFVLFAIAISIGIMVWFSRLSENDNLEGIALGFILGGALGNLIDRIYNEHVIDFIDFYVQNWHWYTFNIADIAICIGAGLLLLASFKKPADKQIRDKPINDK